MAVFGDEHIREIIKQGIRQVGATPAGVEMPRAAHDAAAQQAIAAQVQLLCPQLCLSLALTVASPPAPLQPR
jgi:hypothetical protein